MLMRDALLFGLVRCCEGGFVEITERSVLRRRCAATRCEKSWATTHEAEAPHTHHRPLDQQKGKVRPVSIQSREYFKSLPSKIAQKC